MRKTAGYTLRTLLHRQYGGRRHVRLLKNYFTKPELSVEDVRTVAASPPADVRVAHGHILFWPDIKWPDGTRFFTLVRDPVERAISHYYWVRERNPRFSKTLEEAVREGLIPDNMQTRVLAASSAPFGELTEEALERAVASLDRFSVVGLTERFDDSLVLLTRTFGWRRMLYKRANVTRARRPREQIAPEALEMIRRHNAFDLELYRCAVERFERTVAEQGDDFAVEVAALQRANARLGSIPEDGELDPLPSAISNGPPGAPVDLRELLIEAQAELLLREDARLALIERSEKAQPKDEPEAKPAPRAEQPAAKKHRAKRAPAARVNGKSDALRKRAAQVERNVEVAGARLAEVRGRIAELEAANGSAPAAARAELERLRRRARYLKGRVQTLDERREAVARQLAARSGDRPAG